MSITDVVVIVIAAVLTAVLWRFFFGARRSSRAELRGADVGPGLVAAATEGAEAKVRSSKADQHFTEPPPRY